MAFLQGKSLRRRAEPVAASQQGASRPNRLKRSAVRIETPVQRYGAPSYSKISFSEAY